MACRSMSSRPADNLKRTSAALIISRSRPHSQTRCGRSRRQMPVQRRLSTRPPPPSASTSTADHAAAPVLSSTRSPMHPLFRTTHLSLTSTADTAARRKAQFFYGRLFIMVSSGTRPTYRGATYQKTSKPRNVRAVGGTLGAKAIPPALQGW